MKDSHGVKSALVVGFATLSILWFPWLFAVAMMGVAESFVPGVAFALGIFADLALGVHGFFSAPFPVGTAVGALIVLFLYGVRRFTHRRLIGPGIPAVLPHLFDR